MSEKLPLVSAWMGRDWSRGYGWAFYLLIAPYPDPQPMGEYRRAMVNLEVSFSWRHGLRWNCYTPRRDKP